VAGIESRLWPLILLFVLGSAVGLFYYLRIVVAMYGPLLEAADVPVTTPAPSLAFVTSLVLTLGVVWLGLYPALLIDAINLMVASLL
jgi:NADH-quinone oxidoreductase subunit N